MPNPKYLSENGLLYLWQRLQAIFATKSEAGDENVIETIKVNSSALTPDANKAVDITVPTNTNQLTNGAGFQTAAQVTSAINSAIEGITGISFEVVQTLPATGDSGTIYLKPNSGSGTNIYDEYIYYNNAWEMIGTTAVDLSNYISISDELSNSEIAEIIDGTGA